MKQTQIAVDKIHPNPWNPNKQSEQVQRAERESIRLYGFIDPVTVRPHPDKEGEYQIIDGEHRWLAAQDEQISDVPATVLDVPDSTARKLTIVLNETKGEADLALMGRLLGELKMELPDDEFRMALPWDERELDHMMRLGAVDWDKFEAAAPPDPSENDDEWFSILVRAPAGFQPMWEDIVQRARADGVQHQQPAIEAGMILEVLAAEYLAAVPK